MAIDHSMLIAAHCGLMIDSCDVRITGTEYACAVL
jgi:hypothetical protein